MVNALHKMFGLERMSDYRGVRLQRIHVYTVLASAWTHLYTVHTYVVPSLHGANICTFSLNLICPRNIPYNNNHTIVLFYCNDLNKSYMYVLRICITCRSLECACAQEVSCMRLRHHIYFTGWLQKLFLQLLSLRRITGWC